MLLKYCTKIFIKENNKDNGDPEVQKIEIVEGKKEGERERKTVSVIRGCTGRCMFYKNLKVLWQKKTDCH